MMGERTRQLMKSIFNVDHPIMRGAERIFDLVMLNLLFLVSCLPIVTIGVAKLSLYRVLLEMKETQHVPIFSLYSSAFKQHLKKGMILGVLELGLTFFCWFYLSFFGQIGAQWSVVAQAACIGLFLLVLLTFLYLYPLALRLEVSLKELFKTAFVLASLHLPKSALMLLVLGSLFFLLYSSSMAFLLGISLLLVIGFAGLGYLYMQLLETILEQYTTPS